jgi:uncharacterized protein YfiM (DUF2279 family)
VCLALASFFVASSARASEPWWGPDKALHLSVSAGLAAAASVISAGWIELRAARSVVAFISALALGIGKEWADVLGLGTPSMRDYAWDAVGAAVGALLSGVIDALLVQPLLVQLAPFSSL